MNIKFQTKRHWYINLSLNFIDPEDIERDMADRHIDSTVRTEEDYLFGVHVENFSTKEDCIAYLEAHGTELLSQAAEKTEVFSHLNDRYIVKNFTTEWCHLSLQELKRTPARQQDERVLSAITSLKAIQD